MAQRLSPTDYFTVKQNVQTQEPVRVETLQTEPALTIDNNALVILGIVAVVGLIGLFALLASDRKCR